MIYLKSFMGRWAYARVTQYGDAVFVSGLYPTESVWMIPGTINPLD
jgi:hypothetical protein